MHLLGPSHSYFIAKELQQRGHELRVLYPAFDPSLPDGSVSEDFYDGLRVARLNRNPQQPGDMTALFRDPSVATALQPYISTLALDLVHFQHLSGFSASALEAFSNELVPVAFTVHDGWLLCEQCHFLLPQGHFCREGPETVERCAQCFLGRNPQVPRDKYATVSRMLSLRNQTLQQAMSLIDTMLVPTQFIQRALARHGFKPEHVVLSPLGLHPYSTLPKQPSEGIMRFLYLGNICHTKALIS